MAAYLAEHVPHLQRLHVQLGLPPEALQSDQNAIEAAIKNAVTTLIRDREGEVDGWRDAIADVRRSMVSVGRALGEKGRDAVAAARRESENSTEALPTQHERLVKQREGLEKEYDERLAQIETVMAQIDQLATMLGAPFEPAKPLAPIPGPSRVVAAPPAGRAVPRKVSSASLTAGPSTSRRLSTMPPPAVVFAQESAEASPWYNVADDVLEALQVTLAQAEEERTARVQQLVDGFTNLSYLSTELVLPTVPIAHPHHFPIHLLPPKTSEERPGAHAVYEKALSRFVSANPAGAAEVSYETLDGLEPEVGLLSWIQEIEALWQAELDTRMGQIQALYDQIEPLWQRLEIEQDQTDLFMEMNHGCGEAVIRAYEAELDRCLELRRSSLSSFVLGARREIELLWEELMLSEDEKGDFGGFINDDYTEELLQEHEDEAERLRAEIESKATMLPKVREWHALKADEEELERTQNDPNRFSARGGAMLREEKLRKRVGILLPRIETDLLNSLPKWEEANSRPFMVQGQRVIDTIYEAREAKEAAKEAKKRAKMGLGPAKTVKATPAVNAARNQPASNASRKREAPTPTPFGTAMSKRQKVAGALPSTVRQPTTKGRIASNPSRQTPHGHGGSPTPLSGLPRAVSHGSTMRSVSSSTAVSTSTDRTRVPSLTYMSSSKAGAGLSKAEGRVPRRQSFKPRQSIAGGLLVAMKARRSSTGWSMREEDEEEVF